MAQLEHHHIQTFSDLVTLKAQVMKERVLRGFNVVPLSGKETFFDDYGARTMKKKTGRAQPISFEDSPTGRRKVVWETFFDNFLFEDDDWDRMERNLLGNGPFLSTFTGAMNKEIEVVAMKALTGTAQGVDVDGETATTFDLDTALYSASAAGNFVGRTFGATAGAFTYPDDINRMHWVLNGKEVDDMNEQRYIFFNSAFEKKMLNDSTLTSADYQSIQRLVRGEMANDAFHNAIWIRTNRIYDETGALDTAGDIAIMTTKTAVNFGMPRRWGMRTFVAEQPQIQGKPNALTAEIRMGATRQHEDRVVVLDLQQVEAAGV